MHNSHSLRFTTLGQHPQRVVSFPSSSASLCKESTGSVAVEGTNGEASVPEEKANEEQAEEKAKDVQVCVRVAWVCDVDV